VGRFQNEAVLGVGRSENGPCCLPFPLHPCLVPCAASPFQGEHPRLLKAEGIEEAEPERIFEIIMGLSPTTIPVSHQILHPPFPYSSREALRVRNPSGCPPHPSSLLV